MQILFILVGIGGVAYFICAYRKFDFFSLSFLSACLYFFPGFVGFTFRYASNINQSEILDETYLVMISVLLAIIIGSFFYDKAVKTRIIDISLRRTGYTAHLALLLAVLGLLVTIFQSGSIFFISKKAVVLNTIGRWYIIWVIAAGFSVVISFIQKKYWVFLLSVLLILADVYVGFRTTIVLSVISIMVYVLSKEGKSRVILVRWKEILFFSLCAVLILLYKQFYVLVKTGEWDLIISRLIDYRGIIDSLTRSEPFIIQATLNEVIRNDFHVSIEHLSGIFHNFILFSPSFGIDTISFNSLFQPVLFPNVVGGMASNIWAEMWSTGGWFLLIIFIIIYVIFISVGSFLLNISDLTIRGLIIILFSYWSFYIHRNDITYQLTLEKRVFLIGLFCVIGSVLILSILPTKRKYEKV